MPITQPETPQGSTSPLLVRGFNDADGVRQHKNEITSFLDASVVYGSDQKTADELRSFDNGKLKIDGEGLLHTTEQREGKGFLAGDTRATENPC